MLALSSSLRTLLLDRMQERKWISPVRSKTDGRSRQVSLAAAGKVQARELEVATPAMEAEWKGIRSSAEGGMLIELLAKVADGNVDPPTVDPSNPTSQAAAPPP